VRWVVVEAVARYHGGEVIAPTFRRIAERRGTMIAQVAAARKLLTLVFYGLRDGEIRCLYREAAWAGSDTARARARETPWPPTCWRGRQAE